MDVLKEEGTKYFQSGAFPKAIESYKKALVCENVPLETQCILLSNIAACYLKLNDYSKVIDAVDDALARAPASTTQLKGIIMEKLLFRRAQAYMETEQLAPCARDLKAVLQIAPSNKGAQTLLRLLQEKARKDASGVGKALKNLPELDALQFLEYQPTDTAAAVYRDVVDLHGEQTIWAKCVSENKDIVIQTRGLRILTNIAKYHAAQVYATIDITLLSSLIPVPIPNDEKIVSQITAAIGLISILTAHVITSSNDITSAKSAIRQLLDTLLQGLRSQNKVLQQATLDGLLKNVLQCKSNLSVVATWMDEMGIFSLLLSKANILVDGVVSSVSMVFSQIVAQFTESETERLVREYCVDPVVHAKTMEEAAPGCVLLSGVFLANAKLGSHMMQSHPSFLKQLSEVLLKHKNDADSLKYQELVMDLVAYISGSEAGIASIPIELRMELGKLLQCDMSPHQMKLQSSALAAIIKMGLVDKTFDPKTPVGEIMVEQVLALLENVNLAPVASSVIGSTARERAIEALSYIITFTGVKDALIRRPKALEPILTDISATTTPSNLLYGISYILFHLLTSESHLKKQKMQNSELTPEQYEELQRALKQKSELDDGDSPEQVQKRIRVVLEHPKSILTMLQLLKCKASPAILEQATQSVLHATEYVEGRGKLIQGGLFSAMLSLASTPAQHAVAKILITTNPNLIPSSQLLSSIHPLINLLKEKSESTLIQFEALMALTNVASVSEETKRRILSNNGLMTIQYLQFSDHNMVRRAATECLTNLLPCDEVLEKIFCQPDKIRLWLALSSVEEAEEDFETARAASGAIAMVSQYPVVCAVLMEQKAVETFGTTLVGSSSPELIHRNLFAIQSCIEYVNTMDTPDAAAKGTQAMYEQQLLLLEEPIRGIVRNFASVSQDIVDVAKTCLTLLAKLH
ncbi:unc-45 family protein [Thraustotheca clavata]|uniref:Protein unc-45 homolog B n=1 Tax=Thraustotheca clavata TaxID=74557 RepID=A0A1W0A4Z3_9STRA|nr:unc-45 family protein [Thraustotheca clavata]